MTSVTACAHNRQNWSPVGPVCLDCKAVLTVLAHPPEAESVRMVPLTARQRAILRDGLQAPRVDPAVSAHEQLTLWALLEE